MAFSKASLYSNQEKRVARIANALAHPARVKILNQLKLGELPFQELLELHPINQSSFSQHLRILRLAGLIEYSCCGNEYFYSLLFDNLPEWVELIMRGMSPSDKLVQAA